MSLFNFIEDHFSLDLEQFLTCWRKFKDSPEDFEPG